MRRNIRFLYPIANRIFIDPQLTGLFIQAWPRLIDVLHGGTSFYILSDYSGTSENRQEI